MSEQLEYPATATVHWPSGPVDACHQHARELVALSSFMGAHVAVTHAPAGAQCSNCMNESNTP